MNRSFTCNYFAHFPRKCHPEGGKFCKAKLWLSNGCKFCEKHLNQWPRPHKYHVQFLSAPLKINDTTQKREGVGLVVAWLLAVASSSPQAVLMLSWYANRAIITTLLLFIAGTLKSDPVMVNKAALRLGTTLTFQLVLWDCRDIRQEEERLDLI